MLYSYRLSSSTSGADLPVHLGWSAPPPAVPAAELGAIAGCGDLASCSSSPAGGALIVALTLVAPGIVYVMT